MNNYNWQNKDERAEVAKEHTKLMAEQYSDDIKRSIDNSVVYRNLVNTQVKESSAALPKIDLLATDSVSAIFATPIGTKRTAVLNFASYKNPGGMFIEGSRAQEECLCHESFLYNVLKTFEDTYYTENRTKLNKGLYTNAAIYSPDVRFEHYGNIKYTGVLTCAAPNKTTAIRYKMATKEECSTVLEDRIKYVIDILSTIDVDAVVLGAFGCGVFGQDPYEVAKLFKKYLPRLKGKHIIFAIPDENSTNYKAFKSIFE